MTISAALLGFISFSLRYFFCAFRREGSCVSKGQPDESWHWQGALCGSGTEMLLFLYAQPENVRELFEHKATDAFSSQLQKPVTKGIHTQRSPKYLKLGSFIALIQMHSAWKLTASCSACKIQVEKQWDFIAAFARLSSSVSLSPETFCNNRLGFAGSVYCTPWKILYC